jgi:hypothetical protein
VRVSVSGSGAPRIKGYGGGGAAESALDRAKHVRRAESDIGAEAAALCRACAVADQSWRALARKLGVSCTTARKRTIAALDALADVWRRR